MKYTPRAIPDERTIQILYGQAMNLAMESIGTIKEMSEGWRAELESRQQYFFDQLMLPYKPLLEARQEKEDLFNGKIRKKEINEDQEDQKGEINYEENND